MGSEADMEQIYSLLDRVNGLFREYIKTQKQIESEKEAYLLEMEYTPVPENRVLLSVLKSGGVSQDWDYLNEVRFPNDLKPEDYAVYQDLILNRTLKFFS